MFISIPQPSEGWPRALLSAAPANGMNANRVQS